MTGLVASSENERRLRAELAGELGFFPADLDDESIAGYRVDQLNPPSDPAVKWRHLAEAKRQCDVEKAGRAEVADWTTDGQCAPVPLDSA